MIPLWKRVVGCLTFAYSTDLGTILRNKILKVSIIFIKKVDFSLINLGKHCQSLINIVRRNDYLSFTLFSLTIFGWLTVSNANLYQTQDTKAWVWGSQWLRPCFLQRVYLQTNSEACGRISPYPIWNNLIALGFSRFTDDQIKLWHYLNVICFTVYLCIIIYLNRSLSFLSRLSIFYSILLSPLLFQANSTFTELQQGLFLTLAVISLIRRQVIQSYLFIPLSITSKEPLILVWTLILSFNQLRDIVNALKDLYKQNHWQAHQYKPRKDLSFY